MLKDKTNGTTGTLSIVLTDENGNVKDERKIENLVVSTGKELIASRLMGITESVPTHMAIGSNSTAAQASDASLITELGRVAFDSMSYLNNVTSYSATFGPGVGTGALVEAGIFNSVTTGLMLCRTTFLEVNKAALDTLTINWEVTIN